MHSNVLKIHCPSDQLAFSCASVNFLEFILNLLWLLVMLAFALTVHCDNLSLLYIHSIETHSTHMGSYYKPTAELYLGIIATIWASVWWNKQISSGANRVVGIIVWVRVCRIIWIRRKSFLSRGDKKETTYNPNRVAFLCSSGRTQKIKKTSSTFLESNNVPEEITRFWLAENECILM